MIIRNSLFILAELSTIEDQIKLIEDIAKKESLDLTQTDLAELKLAALNTQIN